MRRDFLIFKLYELFTLMQRNMSIPAYYSSFQDILDRLEVHQPLVTNLKILREYHYDIAAAKFLSCLDSSLLA